MMCGLCVEACPFDAIHMSHEYELADHATRARPRRASLLDATCDAAAPQPRRAPKPKEERGCLRPIAAVPFVVLALAHRSAARRWSMLTRNVVHAAFWLLEVMMADGRPVPAAVRRVPRARAGARVRGRRLGARCCSPSCSRCAAARTPSARCDLSWSARRHRARGARGAALAAICGVRPPIAEHCPRRLPASPRSAALLFTTLGAAVRDRLGRAARRARRRRVVGGG